MDFLRKIAKGLEKIPYKQFYLILLVKFIPKFSNFNVNESKIIWKFDPQKQFMKYSTFRTSQNSIERRKNIFFKK